jgi:hypothetical protein
VAALAAGMGLSAGLCLLLLLLLALALLAVFVEDIACGDEFEAAEDDHFEGLFAMLARGGRWMVKMGVVFVGEAYKGSVKVFAAVMRGGRMESCRLKSHALVRLSAVCCHM